MRKINVNTTIRRPTRDGNHYYIDPVFGEEVGPFDSPTARDEAIKEHYNELPRCQHVWEELSRTRCHFEPGMVSGHQRCTECGETVHYRKEDNE